MVRLLSCLLLLVGLRGNAQLWNKTYIEDRPVMLFSSVLLTDNRYTLLGVTLDKGGHSNAQRCLIAKADETGNIIEYVSLYDSTDTDYATFSNTLLQTNNGKFAFTGYAGDSLLFGILGDSVLTYTYYTPNTYAFQGHGMIQHTDNSYYITGIRSTVSPSDGNIVLVKIDSAGNRIWERYYGVVGKLEAAKSITVLRNGNLMIGGARDNRNQGNTLLNTWLIEVDTGGGIVRQWYDPNDSTYSAEGLKQTMDGGFAYAGQKKIQQTVNTIHFAACVTKLDSDFNKLWTFQGGFPGDLTGFTDLEELSDGSFVVCGKYNYRLGWIVKLSANGHVVWERTYVGISTTGSENYLTDIDVLPDGSLIAVGQCQHSGHTPPQVGWFLKLDSNGCEIENCTVGIEQTPKSPKGDLNSRIQVWPNPFSTDLSLTLSEGEGIIPNATFTITNTTGQVVYRQQEHNLATGYTKMLDLSYLPNGVYFVEVSTAAGKAVQRVVKE